MKNFQIFFSVISAFVFFTASAPSFGWGELGHGVVGEVAERLLQPAVKKKVHELLQASGGGNLAEAANWADLMRSNPNFKNTGIDTWHYATVKSETGELLAVENVVYGISLMEKIIAEGQSYKVPKKDPNVATEDVIIDTAAAVKLLAHFVGDIHQPLHVGNDKDFGANNCLVKWFGAVRRDEGFWNLHAVWDEALIHSTDIGMTALADQVITRLNDAVKAEILSVMEPTKWALETSALRQSVYPQLDPNNKVEDVKQPYCNNPMYAKLPRAQGNSFNKQQFDEMETKLLADNGIPRLGYDYRYAQLDLAKRQMLTAGVRLAAKLNQLLAVAKK